MISDVDTLSMMVRNGNPWNTTVLWRNPAFAGTEFTAAKHECGSRLEDEKSMYKHKYPCHNQVHHTENVCDNNSQYSFFLRWYQTTLTDSIAIATLCWFNGRYGVSAMVKFKPVASNRAIDFRKALWSQWQNTGSARAGVCRECMDYWWLYPPSRT